MENNNGDNGNGPKPNIALIAERQREMKKRLDEMEKKQKEAETLVNRYIGGIAILGGVIVLLGWLFTVFGSGVLQFFR